MSTRATRATGQWLRDWSAAWSDFRATPAEEYIDAGDDVVLVFRVTATGRSSGISVERQDAIVCGIREGKIARVDYYNNRAQALRQVGLEP